MTARMMMAMMMMMMTTMTMTMKMTMTTTTMMTDVVRALAAVAVAFFVRIKEERAEVSGVVPSIADDRVATKSLAT